MAGPNKNELHTSADSENFRPVLRILAQEVPQSCVQQRTPTVGHHVVTREATPDSSPDSTSIKWLPSVRFVSEPHRGYSDKLQDRQRLRRHNARPDSRPTKRRES